jgi:hypothetical protein
LPLAEKLNERLKHGRIYKEKGKYVNLVFYKLNIVFLIAYLINGKMRTPKIETSNKLIEWFKIRFSIEIKLLGPDTSDIKSNSGLSGFLDSDGSFYSNFDLNKNNIAINLACYMRLSQRQSYPIKDNLVNSRSFYYGLIDQIGSDLDTQEILVDKDLKIADGKICEKSESFSSYFLIMDKIRVFLSVNNLRIINRKRKNNFIELGYEIRTSKKESNKILINYLDNYPLYSSKFLDFINWKKIYEMKINKEYKLIKGTNLLVNLKSSMNSIRTEFNWELLNNMWII